MLTARSNFSVSNVEGKLFVSGRKDRFNRTAPPVSTAVLKTTFIS
jgi:hypothetical protein